MTQIALYNPYCEKLNFEKLDKLHFLLGLSKKKHLVFLTFRAMTKTSVSSFRRGHLLLRMSNIKKLRGYKL